MINGGCKMEMIGKILGNRYEIQEKIGSGGMATVYKARCRLLNRKVAIKILRDEFASDVEFIKRFQVEAQAAASLSHPNIVSIYDVGNDDGMHYIVMELIEGKTLKDIINEKGKLPWRQAVDYASQIASGLSEAHSNHIIHRDIKPHNIIITKAGVAKVTDFGIAKAVSNSTINAFGSTIGSVHYFSPEHARGGYTDEKSDLYSLGVVLYEMLTGKLPFDAETPVSVALKHLQEVPLQPIEVCPDIPENVNNIVMKAMQKDVNNRYSSANEMNIDLQEVLKNPERSVEIEMLDKKEFPTQKIPIVGTANKMDEDFSYISRSSKNSKRSVAAETEFEEEEKKKPLTKKQALVRLGIFVGIAIVILFGSINLAMAIAPMILGNPNIPVPNILGMHKDEAAAVLADSKLVMEIEAEVNNSTYPKDYVVSQSYGEGYRLKEGSTVTVRISKGAETVLVPDVTTMSPEAAKIEIEKNKLVYVPESEASLDVPEGGIIRQSPGVNEEVEVGTEIKVYISIGAIDGLVRVPDLLGKTEEEARQLADDNKLLVEVVYAENTAKADGIVLSQDPDKEASVSELSEIKIVVNKLKGSPIDDPSTDPSDDPSDETPDTTPKRTVTIDLKNKGTRDVFMVKVVVQGQTLGTRTEYEEMHSRKDGKITVPISETGSGIIKVYIDDVLDSEQVISAL
jgi:serine/threonine-protein kinase